MVAIFLIQFAQVAWSLGPVKSKFNSASKSIKHRKDYSSKDLAINDRQLLVAKHGVTGVASSLMVLLAPLVATAAAGVPVGNRRNLVEDILIVIVYHSHHNHLTLSSCHID